MKIMIQIGLFLKGMNLGLTLVSLERCWNYLHWMPMGLIFENFCQNALGPMGYPNGFIG
jgi:hypothetical protein